MRSIRHTWLGLALIALGVIAASGPVAAQCGSLPGNFRPGSHEHFTLQFTDPLGATVALKETDAYEVKRTCPCGFQGKVWKIRIPGTTPAREVWVTALAVTLEPMNVYRYFMGYAYPQGLPEGWRVDYLEQAFQVDYQSEPVAAQQRIACPIVYGPTFYTLAEVAARDAGRLARLYPTFLQTQQVTLEDTATGDCLSMATNDDRGNRKLLGVESDGTVAGTRFLVRYIPDQGTSDPNTAGWMAPYCIQFGRFTGGLEEAIDWYRNEQLKRPGSFLWNRQPNRYGVHPAIDACKFVIGVGASFSPDVLPHGQFDVSAQYRQDLLDYFGLVHGDHMLLYHLGWYQESPFYIAGIDPIYPYLGLIPEYMNKLHVVNDDSLPLGQGTLPLPYLPTRLPAEFQTITPGHAALIAEARARNRHIGSVAYTLPAIQTPSLDSYDPATARLEADGLPSEFETLRPEGSHTHLCWFVDRTKDLYTSLYVNDVFGQSGFAGAYLDALSPAPTCYGFHEHSHPRGVNEQLFGIDRALCQIRFAFRRGHQVPPLLINETPCDCLSTDGSALDYNMTADPLAGVPANPDYHNLFAMTYSGAEWPRFGVVFGIDFGTFGPDGHEYLVQLANALASGTRPLILWPEYRLPQSQVLSVFGFPTSPAAVSDIYFPLFLNLLNSYSANYQSFWKDIVEGRRLEPLDPADVILDSIVNPPPPPPYPEDPYTTKWRIPGWKPRPNGRGCYPMRLSDRPHPTVYHGLFEPKDRPGERRLVLVNWADPSLIGKLPAGHPACRPIQRVQLRLSAHNTRARPGGLIRFLKPRTQTWINLGRLPQDPGQKIGPLAVEFDRMEAGAVVID